MEQLTHKTSSGTGGEKLMKLTMFTCQSQGEDRNIDARVTNCRDEAIQIADALIFSDF